MGKVRQDLHGHLPGISAVFNPRAAQPFLLASAVCLIICPDSIDAKRRCQRRSVTLWDRSPEIDRIISGSWRTGCKRSAIRVVTHIAGMYFSRSREEKKNPIPSLSLPDKRGMDKEKINFLFLVMQIRSQ